VETVEPSSNHSYKPSIIGQMIMLPSHGQSTAAVEHLNVTGQVRLLMVGFTRSDVFVIQARLILPSSFTKFSRDVRCIP